MALEARDYDDDEENPADLKQTDWSNLRQTGKSLWAELDYAGQQKRDATVKGLKEFEKATGFSKKKDIEKVKGARNSNDLRLVEDQLKEKSKAWYEKQLDDSGLFHPMDGREEALLNFEQEELKKRFAKLPLAGEDMNMATVLANLQKDLIPRRRFRNRLITLKDQNPDVWNEYFDRVPTLGLLGSREKLLTSIIKEIKPVINKPKAIKKAFKDRRKQKGGKAETAALVSEVIGEYDKKVDAYNKKLAENAQYFGGNTLKEFKDYFAGLENFEEMDAKMLAQPEIIAHRKALYEKAHSIIGKSKPENQDRLKEIVKGMRRHELEKYMETLEKSVQNDSMSTAETGASLLKEVDGVPLFSKFEIDNENRKMGKISLQGQAGQMESIKLEVEDREKTVKEYLELPDKMRDDETFMQAHNEDRIKMLQDAKDKQLTGADNDFDLAANDDIGYIDNLADELEDSDGDKFLDEMIDEQENEGETESAELISLTRRRIGLSDKNMKMHNEDQEDAYVRDTKKWIRLNEGAEEESDVHTQREKTKVKFIQQARKGYKEGWTVNSAGVVTERQDVNARELRVGDKKALERVKRARYGFEINVQKEDGVAQERETGKMLDNLSKEQMTAMVTQIVNMVVGQLKMSAGKTRGIQNSDKIKDVVTKRLIQREYFNHMKKEKQAA